MEIAPPTNQELQKSVEELRQSLSLLELAKEELKGKTAFLEAQANASIDGILVVDHEGRKILQNQRTVDLFKIPKHLADERDNTNQRQWVGGVVKDPQQYFEKIAHLNSHRNEITRDELELKDGTILDRYSAPVVGEKGQSYGRIWTFRDITDRRRLETQLFQSRKMEVIGQLAGGIAHDFNNFLTVVLGNAELLTTTAGSGDAASPLRKIREAAEGAAGLTRQLLAFSRRQVVHTKALDLNEMLGDFAQMLRRILGEDLRLDMDLAAGLPPIDADVGMLEQVMLNLSVNARDAMPGGGSLSVRTADVWINAMEARIHPDAYEGRFVRLALSDTGHGIAPELLPRIFEPFFSTKKPGQGTGLGLATVDGIVRQHRGWTLVRSRIGLGTTFEIYFPAAAQAPAPAPPTVTGQPNGGAETILLVEDEDAVREIAQMILERQGYQVLAARSGVEALPVWAEHSDRINLVVTDMVMPGGMTGRQLAERLIAAKPALKVIFTSGYSEDFVSKGFSLVEGVNFLQKPYAAGKLLGTIRACLDAPVHQAPAPAGTNA